MRFIIDGNSDYINLEIKLMKVARRAINKFLNNCGNAYDAYIGLIYDIPVNIHTTENFRRCCGEAFFTGVSNDPKKITELHMTFTHRIERYNKAHTYEIVSHELAHCVDFLIRGDSFHDEPWRQIHRLMGGTGETFIEYRWIEARKS